MLRRRSVLRAAAATALAPLSRLAPSSHHAADAAGRPDVVILMTDDMRETDWERGLPRTRALLEKRGTWYPNFFITSPVCSPSRASVLTGMYPHNHGIDGTRISGNADRSFPAFQENDLANDTIAFMLQNSGYRTGLVGKFLNAFPKDAPPPLGWDSWTSTVTQDYAGFTLNENGTAKSYGGNSYSTDVLRAAAIDFIDSVPRDKPLFLYFTPTAPHTPLKPAPRHRGDFAGAQVDLIEGGTRKPWFNEQDVSDKPEYVQNRRRESEADLDRAEQLRLESLKSADEAFVAVLNRLNRRGGLDNAYVFVLSDNGFALGAHGWVEKAVPYDPVVRVPMLAAGRGFAGGGTDERLVANIDVAPTIARLAGVAGRLRRADGRNLLDTMGAWRTDVYLAWGGPDRWRAVRTKDGATDELYVENGTGEREYYDYTSDRYELDNKLATWKDGYVPDEAADTRAEVLAERVEALRACKRTSCP